ncbi:hypothetical protein SAMN02745120_1022 [Acetoanaerobium noterae]|uniref:HeH/LEM domain-containing protein n=1 Tax=Acetoanaerobium noterae TaxID=745369 RepID=A0A1T5AM30_9FIRM|nr:hypothetical protein [Acetoanaerobium noterae]SKB36038.1 hypothetical protein SAMN02745120_1022 [Acetoanaerobium noterae]
MLVVKHEFQDKYSGKVIKVGTILEIEDENRKKDLLSRQLIVEADVLVLKQDDQEEESELTVKEIKLMLEEKGIEYTPRDNKAKLLQLLKGDS